MKYLRFFLNAAVSIIIIVLILQKINFAEVFDIVRHSKMPFFLLSLFIGALSIIINAFRWHLLLKHLGYVHSLGSLSKVSFIALFFNTYLPGGIAGDIARVAIFPKGNGQEMDKAQTSKVAASVITDRVVGMVGLMILALLGLAFSYELLFGSKILPIFAVMAVVIIFIFFILFSKRAQHFINDVVMPSFKLLSPLKSAVKDVSRALLAYRDNYLIFVKVISLSMAAHLCVVGYFFLLARSIGVSISFLKLLAFVPVIEFISALPISFGGVGVRETATIFMFSSEGINAPEAMSVSLLSFVVILLLGLVGGGFFACRNNKN
ncbi:MAG: lysylphosphatidylglycerol synthase transmembrane domain-containing protein [Candidatus Omnitrophota bacterium]|nr:lysylphosphatidylglycerol synthase transmembrane domain-containing protein [Candidatus Omnitrophota bacterium]